MNTLINNSYFNDCQHETALLKESIRQSVSSRRSIYCNVINTNLSTHSIYSSRHNIYEMYRIAFTRFRVSSHMLAVETGRWNRRGRGRLPMEERLCSCGLVQSEDHVINECPLSQIIRDNYAFANINELMAESFSKETVCKIIYEVLELYR